MSTKPDIKTLGSILGHIFEDTKTVELALTHSSYSSESYERLEFLGDRVLGLVMAEILFEMFPNEPEGDLAKRHTALVNGETLAEIAREIKLGQFITLSDAERAAGGDNNTHILADVMEALIATIYMEAGLYKTARILKTLWGNRFETMKRPPQDPKTKLQEWAQGRGYSLPEYKVISRDGPDHAPYFTIEVHVESVSPVSATAGSKRVAEKEAAIKMLANIKKGQS